MTRWTIFLLASMTAALAWAGSSPVHPGSHNGLVQRYAKPVTADRHDALSPSNLLSARYTPDDKLIPVDRFRR